MTLETLQKTWVSAKKHDSGAQQKMWDDAACDFVRDIPRFDENPFLKQIENTVPLTENTAVLDIGCGAGRFALAFAPRVGRVTATDISPKMIALAEKQAAEHGADNIDFFSVDWKEIDLDAREMRGAYDVVFAHMTPAITDYASLDTMNACAKNHCFIVKPARRTDPLLQELSRLVGIDNREKKLDSDIIHLFSYLWLKGYEPRFNYRNEVWEQLKTVEEATLWYTNRLNVTKKLTDENRQTIADHIEGISQAGVVHNNTTTSIVTVDWSVKPR